MLENIQIMNAKTLEFGIYTKVFITAEAPEISWGAFKYFLETIEMENEETWNGESFI